MTLIECDDGDCFYCLSKFDFKKNEFIYSETYLSHNMCVRSSTANFFLSVFIGQMIHVMLRYFEKDPQVSFFF